MPLTRRPYPSDLADEEWALLEPLLASHDKVQGLEGKTVIDATNLVGVDPPAGL